MAKAGKELYVGSLSYDITEYELLKLFAVSGTVTSMHLIRDPETGQFKGCGYVRMSTEAEARDAIDSLDGAWLLDKKITVSYANPQKMKASGGGAKTLPRWRIEAAEKKAAEKKATAALAATKPAAKPAAKPATKSAAKPAARPTASPDAKPTGARPAAAKAGAAKPAGARPTAAKAGSARPAGARPAAAKAGSARPSGASRPAGSKPASRPGNSAKPGSRTGKR
ncbi:RNA recognition motif domain-containing protein [Geomonas propionica]|uniref:RNA-binding protein n=1 Tax=Geomonas propionica TaxID=2798582 RepID=A0ABS0YLM0_9BACT|nr:RNA-binding protein [Geomonas propionica]MBJ6798844.1 RNA-binding protein [Geomonas propionica]